ncbi:hypothetical protein [Marinicella sp. W31]|uniref:hypothetical protein n=1 Tax=Marinicella sp. W31 TaxID=3023713 RepID=UPI003756C559
MQKTDAKQINIKLSVAYVEFGGNAGTNGQYFYAFNPSSVYILSKDVSMNFILSDNTDPRFKIVEFLSSDGIDQFKNPQHKADNRVLSVTNKNASKQVIKISIIVRDNEAPLTDGFFNCDPQVLNSPGTWD